MHVDTASPLVRLVLRPRDLVKKMTESGLGLSLIGKGLIASREFLP